MNAASTTTILHAYRSLLRASLRAVHYSKPARYVALDRLRSAFRTNDASAYDALTLGRTLEFLGGAANVRGLEHKIVRNLMHVLHERKKLPRINTPKENLPFRKAAYKQFDDTVAKLNETMGLCI
ncbi:hypothetical protein B0A48_02631 [Cryoendolithus antarcticus]|uniref:Uncharacterized protein n=1 Tax=Cryoendolithus antarcticus TaxID=1507870 RepID=A0A1V8TL83_9PEZI|nr:hypothetical protein B0A48_02631 [Cryoendolithus antarcticus]